MLILVATPIGNLKDITLRALETLKQADYILAEDTRTSKKLLNHYEIKTRLVSFHKFNEQKRHATIIDDLQSGLNIALISDAGHPGICDPGSDLVSTCLEKNITITINSGASALTSAISLSGYKGNIQFVGFLPKKKKENILKNAEEYNGATIFYESGSRILNTLEKLNPNTQIMIFRELSKKFETLIKGSCNDVLSEIKKCVKGEFVLMIFGQEKHETTLAEEIFEDLRPLMSTKDAARLAAKFTKSNKKKLYELLKND
tara:strand:- start:6630 stop:7409 length:780 start_codon:yes stop_codon:yes gene_type:complete